MCDWKEHVRTHLPPLAVTPEREAEIVAELALQLDQAYQESLDRGCTEAEAFGAASAQFPDWQKLAREIEASEARQPAKPGNLLTGALHDLRYAARFLRRNVTFGAIAVLTLAFGIGGNVSVFTMVDTLLFRSFPYRESERLVAIETRKAQQPEVEAGTSLLDFQDIRARSQSYASMAGISPILSLVYTAGTQAERLECLSVSASFFDLLGVQPLLGRTFVASEDTRAGANVAILGHGFWQRQMGGSKDAIGKQIVLDGATYQVIGVLRPDFHYAGEPLAGTATEVDVWMPPYSTQLANTLRQVRYLKVIGRLKAGITMEQAKDEMGRIGAALSDQYPDADRGLAYEARPLASHASGRYGLSMMLLLGSAGFVLLLACVNVANLLLARAVERNREITVRVALGASSWRLVRQLLAESLVVALAGGVVGVLSALVGIQVLGKLAPASLTSSRVFTVDARALLFATALVFLAALLAGLPSALKVMRSGIGTALRESGRGLTGGHHRLQSALVTTQVALAIVLLIGAALLVRSFQEVLLVPPGFTAANLVTISTQMPLTARQPEQRVKVLRDLTERLTRVPGVKEVAAVSRLPMTAVNLSSLLLAEGKWAPGGPMPEVQYRVASPNYFRTMGIPLRSGRFFTPEDDANPAAVAIINQSLAQMVWPGEDAVGQRIKLGATPERFPWITVVGVVGDVRHFGLDAEPRPEVYRPYLVNPLYAPILLIRTEVDPGGMQRILADTVRATGPDVPAYNIYRMDALVERSTVQRRFLMMLLSGFALTALLLAAVGIYGTVSQVVAQRTQEIGLRMALGSTPEAALGLVLWSGIRLLVMGAAFGTAASLIVMRLLGNMLFGVQPWDPAALAGALLILGIISVVACYIPARRATRIDPMTALRESQ